MAMTLDVVRAEDVGLSSSRLRRIDDAVARLVRDEAFSGATTLVARRGGIAHFSAIGQADMEAGRAMSRDAIFRIYSMTKPITCVAALMLFEEGHFLLDDPIAEFIPEFGDTKVFERVDLVRPMSIRHLFMHTSGIGYDFSSLPAVASMYSERKIGRLDEALAEKIPRLARIPLNHQPGDGWTYGMSHDVLGRLVEVISGQSFDDFLRLRIFEPLGMSETGFAYGSTNAARVAPVYGRRAGGGLTRSEDREYERATAPAYLNPGGGLVCTTADYARFCQMLLSGGALDGVRILGRKTVELMTIDHTGGAKPLPADWPQDWGNAAYGFGLGVRVLTDLGKSNAGGSLGEYGWSGALSTYFWIDPSEDMYGIFMTQLELPSFRYGRLVQALSYQALV